MSIGIWQILIIVLIVLLLFGRGKISSLMSEMGKGITSFKKGLKEGEEDEPKDRNQSPKNDEEAIEQAKAASKRSKKK